MLYTSEQVLWPDGHCDKGDRCQKLFCAPGHWGTVPPLAGTRGWARCSAQGPQRAALWGHPCAGQGLLCLSYLAVPPRPAPDSQNLTKMYSKAKTSVKMFSVFSSCMTHVDSAINTIPSVLNKALNGKLLVGFQIIISPCFILSWIPGLHYLLHRVFSYLMGDDSSLLLMVFYKSLTDAYGFSVF